MLSDASKAFAESGLQLDALLAEVVRRVADCLGDACLIRILSPDGRTLVCPACFARDPEASVLLKDAIACTVLALEGESVDVLSTGRAILVPSVDPAVLVRRYPRPSVVAFVERFPPRVMMIAPLRTHGRAFGTVTVFSWDPGVV